jgi:hypothetical protein
MVCFVHPDTARSSGSARSGEYSSSFLKLTERRHRAARPASYKLTSSGANRADERGGTVGEAFAALPVGLRFVAAEKLPAAGPTRSACEPPTVDRASKGGNSKLYVAQGHAKSDTATDLIRRYRGVFATLSEAVWRHLGAGWPICQVAVLSVVSQPHPGIADLKGPISSTTTRR